ncbi:MAG: gliding motility-associated C-terminal domain-containing protein [Paludibacteraceae bacterium]|nr:gliding motility-associated C-terminal domain-containing protein [Paludibacteraceae bacterium]
MRKSIALLILLSSFAISHALNVQKMGDMKVKLLYNDGDTIFLFEKEPALESTIGKVAWYRLPDTINPIQQSSDYLDAYIGLEHGGGYMIKKGNIRDVFWVFDYEQLRPTISQVDAEQTCENTVLRLIGEVPQIKYTRLNGRINALARTCRVEYMDAMWSNDNAMWIDSIAVQELEFEQDMTVAASPVTTNYVICDMLANQLGIAIDTLYSPVCQPIALKAHPVTITTTRGNKGEMTNEVNRPYSPEDVLNMSAPLEILFKSNGLNADFYQWKLYKGSNLMLTRNDADHRYTFMDKGNYRAVVTISNNECQLDSVEFTISVSESMLLVPNVFTPNGDGANDEFRVAYRSIKEFHCWVYNRWGHLVYEWSDPAKGWDGTIGGKPAAEGAYFYVIRALGTDADENAKYTLKPIYTKKLKKQDDALIGVYQLSGSINLLRGGK